MNGTITRAFLLALYSRCFLVFETMRIAHERFATIFECSGGSSVTTSHIHLVLELLADVVARFLAYAADPHTLRRRMEHRLQEAGAQGQE